MYAAFGFIFNILLDPEIMYLPQNLRDKDVWLEKGRERE